MQPPRRNYQRQSRASHESSNSRSAYGRTNSMKHVAGRTVMQWKTGSARKKKSRTRKHALSPPNTTCAQSDLGPDPRGLFHVTGDLHHFNRRDRRGMEKNAKNGLVLSLAPGLVISLGEWISWKSWMMER